MVKNIIVPLGVGEHLEYWGLNMSKSIWSDWWDTTLIDNLKIHTLPGKTFLWKRFSQK